MFGRPKSLHRLLLAATGLPDYQTWRTSMAAMLLRLDLAPIEVSVTEIRLPGRRDLLTDSSETMVRETADRRL